MVYDCLAFFIIQMEKWLLVQIYPEIYVDVALSLDIEDWFWIEAIKKMNMI